MSPGYRASGWVRGMRGSRWGPTLLALLALTGCGPPARPDVAQWQSEWMRVRALVPDADASESDAPRAACEVLLVGARSARDWLLPTPSPDLDEPVQQWIKRAESLGFTCPAAHGRADAHREAIASLQVLEAEIDAGLQSATAP